jgi:hypothetical protein
MRNGGDIDESKCHMEVSRLMEGKRLQWEPRAVEIRVQRIGEPGSGVGWEGGTGEK